MKTKILPMLMLGVYSLAIHGASAHGIAGNRVFPATLEVEDPGVADELTLPHFTSFKEREEGGEASRVNEYEAEYSKRITDTFGLSVEGAYIDHAGEEEDGFDNIGLSAKYQAYKDDAHETLLSLGLGWDIGGSGDSDIAESFSTLTPQLFFGQGFGALPDSMELLKPFAVTGSLGVAFPTRDDESDVLKSGFTLQYSIPYLQQHVRDVGLTGPFSGLVPVVEFAFDTPLDHTDDHKTTGTVNPGLIWTGEAMQFGLEAVLPLNNDSGKGVGVTAQVHFYLDDLFPNSLGHPVFGGGKR